jgi:hypothetical protein
MADPPTLWYVCHDSATYVEVGSLWKTHGEYIRNRQEWREKLPRAAGAVVLGHEEAAETVSEEQKWLMAFGHLHALPPERLPLNLSGFVARVKA